MISVKLDNSILNARLKKQTDALAKLPDQGVQQFKALTPIRSGNARSNTDLTSNKNKIVADYAYAQRLDDNWSPQTRGRGIVAPFTVWWKDQLKKISRMK
jgi:hypothetical protein